MPPLKNKLPPRLCGEARIAELFREGKRGRMDCLSYCWLEKAGQEEVEVLFSVPKKNFKRAWKRNLIRRRMKESLRVRKNEFGKKGDLALICLSMPEGEVPDFHTIDNAVAKILHRLG